MNPPNGTPAAETPPVSPEEIKEHERKLLRGVFDAWPQLIDAVCQTANELFKEQVVIAQALDPAPLKVKAVNATVLRAAMEADGMDGILSVLRRVEQNNGEILRRAKALRAERERLAAQSEGGPAVGAPE